MMGGKKGGGEAFIVANRSESIRGKAALAPLMVNAFLGIIYLSQALALQSETNMAVWKHALIFDIYQHPLMSLLCLVLMLCNINN